MKRNLEIRPTDALGRRLQIEAEQLASRRSPGLAQRVLSALPPGPARSMARPHKRSLRLLLPLAAAALLLWIVIPWDLDPAHPKLAPRGATELSQAQLDLGPATAGLRDLVSWSALLRSTPAQELPANDLLEREARLLVSDVTRLAADVIAGLPLAGLPAAWKQRLEAL